MESYFLPGDLKQAAKELECVSYLEIQANKLVEEGEFEKSKAYHYNMIRSLQVLERMRKDKRQHDQAQFVLDQIKADQEVTIMAIVSGHAK